MLYLNDNCREQAVYTNNSVTSEIGDVRPVNPILKYSKTHMPVTRRSAMAIYCTKSRTGIRCLAPPAIPTIGKHKKKTTRRVKPPKSEATTRLISTKTETENGCRLSTLRTNRQ